MQELLNVKAAGTYSDHSSLKGFKPAGIGEVLTRDRP
jgi:hypothetical protein